jgi:hypothetical protein
MIREVKEPQATQSLPSPRKSDWKHKIFYTWDTDDNGTELGSIAVAFDGAGRTVWRFDDVRGSDIDIQKARRWH